MKRYNSTHTRTSDVFVPRIAEMKGSIAPRYLKARLPFLIPPSSPPFPSAFPFCLASPRHRATTGEQRSESIGRHALLGKRETDIRRRRSRCFLAARARVPTIKGEKKAKKRCERRKNFNRPLMNRPTVRLCARSPQQRVRDELFR